MEVQVALRHSPVNHRGAALECNAVEILAGRQYPLVLLRNRMELNNNPDTATPPQGEPHIIWAVVCMTLSALLFIVDSAFFIQYAITAREYGYSFVVGYFFGSLGGAFFWAAVIMALLTVVLFRYEKRDDQ